MIPRIHISASVSALLCIIVFQMSTVISEFFLPDTIIAQVKRLILMPGILILIPLLITTGITGKVLSSRRKGRIIKRKMRRMAMIALNGILILVPSAIYLSVKSAAGELDFMFYTIQILELAAGGINMTLMIKNIQDGRTLGGKYNV